MTQMPAGAPRSPDGQWWWDGIQWQPVSPVDVSPQAAEVGLLPPLPEKPREAASYEREAAYEAVASSCPVPISRDHVQLPGGISLQPDEFLVAVGQDWGLSSQKLHLTTHRLIYSHGRLSKDQRVAYLSDVRDVIYHKPMMGFGTIAIDTASGRIEGLPAAANGAAFRDKLLSLVHWAKMRSMQPSVVASAPAQPAGEDILQKLTQLAELRDARVVTPEEFEAKKAELLRRL
jgi:hypothetical protein